MFAFGPQGFWPAPAKRRTVNGERKELNIGLRSLLVSYAELHLDRCHRFIFPRFGVA